MKTIKFDLPIDGKKVSSIEELQEHFTTEIIGHFRSGVLERWLDSRRDSTFLSEVRKLAGNDEAQSDDALALRELCRIFEVDADEAAIEAAVAEPADVPGGHIRTRKEFLDWFVAATHYLSRLVSPRSGIPDFRRAHLGFGLPDAPVPTDPGEWSAHVVEFINHCQVVVEALKSCPDRVFAETLAAHVSDYVDCVLDSIDGMTKEELDGVPAEVHVEDVSLPIRMEPVRHVVRTPGRTRFSDLQWVSEGAIEQAGDIDWWCFTVLRPGDVTVQANGNPYIVVLLEDCPGGQTDRGLFTNPTEIVRTLGSGTYYIRVSASGTATGSYTLNVRHNTRHAGTDRRDDSELPTASLAVNHSMSRARAIAGRHRQEVLRSLSKERLRELEGIVGDHPDLIDAGWIRACPIIRAAGNAADGESTHEPASWFTTMDGGSSPFNAVFEKASMTVSPIIGNRTRRRITDEQQTALEAFAHALHESGMRVVRRIGDTGLPASGSDTAMYDDA